jgi:hypothetical protein
MAENKKSFVLYADLIKSIEHLTNEEKGILFNHLLEYVNDKNPTLEDRIVLTAWKPIELQLKRDLVKFEKSKDEKSLSGRIGNLKRWNNDLYNQFISKELTIEEAEEIANSRKVSQPDKVQSQPIAKIAVNDNVTVNVNDINNNISTKVESEFDFWWNAYDKKTGKEVCLKKWKKLKTDEQKKCLEVVERYVLSTPDRQYRKNPSTYLNGKHWNDETEVNSQSHIPSTLQYERRPIGTTKSMFE